MADSIRGNGLLIADETLAALLDDPQRLDRARNRFSNSPPTYRSRSQQSGTSTRSQSPNPPSEEQRRREEQKWQLKEEYYSSVPYNQFEAQTSEELKQIIEANNNRTRRVPVGTDFFKLAEENVRRRWVEQGIWNEDWKNASVWRWKHEEPPKPGPELRSESEAEAATPVFTFSTKKAELEQRRPRTDEDVRRDEEQQAVQEREREASRPFHQFLYQILKEGERVRDESSGDGAVISDLADINTRAYNVVKSTWIKRGIWNRKWGILPGMSWKHEQPLEDMLNEEMRNDIALAQESPLEADGLATAPTPPRQNPFASSPPEEPNQPEIDIPNESQQGPADATHLTRLPNDNAEEESARHRPAVQKRRQGKKQPPQHEEARLRKAHASRVSKTPNKGDTSSQRQINVSKPSVSDLPPQPAPITPRRSKRLQEAEPSKAAYAPVLENPGSSASQTKPRKAVVGNSTSARPSGIFKRQRSKRYKAK